MRSRLAAIVTSSADAIIGETLDGIITDWNPAAERLYGYTAEEAIGQHLSILAPVDLVQEPERLLARVRAGESVEGIETVRRTKDGRRIEVSLTVSPVWNDAGEIVAASGISRDITERKAAEVERAATHQNTRQVLERISDGFYALDREWRFTYLNETAERLTGRSRAELLGRNIWEAFAPAIETPAYEAHQRAVREEIPTHVELFYAPLDIWLEVWAYPSPNGLSVFFHDVTERVKAQETQGRLAAIVESADDAIISGTLDGTITSWNRGAERLYGYRAEEMLGRSFRILLPDDQHWTALEPILKAAMAGEPTAQFETTRRRKDGSLVDVAVNVSPVCNGHGVVVGLSTITQDITSRKRTQEALETAKEAWQRSFDALPDHLCVLDRSGAILRANKTMRERFEPIHGSLVGLDYRLVYCGTATPSPPPPCAAVLMDGPPVAVETVLPTMEGQYLVASYPIDIHGERRGAVSVVRDITARKQVERELQAALGAAHVGIRAQGQFLAMMSHELRTPMQAVLGYADILLAGGEGSLTPQQVEDVQAIRRGAERMMALVTQMLDLSRLEAGRMELATGPVDLGTIIAQVRQDVAPQAASKGLDLRIDLPPIFPRSWAIRWASSRFC